MDNISSSKESGSGGFADLNNKDVVNKSAYNEDSNFVKEKLNTEYNINDNNKLSTKNDVELLEYVNLEQVSKLHKDNRAALISQYNLKQTELTKENESLLNNINSKHIVSEHNQETLRTIFNKLSESNWSEIIGKYAKEINNNEVSTSSIVNSIEKDINNKQETIFNNDIKPFNQFNYEDWKVVSSTYTPENANKVKNAINKLSDDDWALIKSQYNLSNKPDDIKSAFKKLNDEDWELISSKYNVTNKSEETKLIFNADSNIINQQGKLLEQEQQNIYDKEELNHPAPSFNKPSPM